MEVPSMKQCSNMWGSKSCYWLFLLSTFMIIDYVTMIKIEELNLLLCQKIIKQ